MSRNKILELLSSFTLATIAGFALTANVAFFESLSTARLGAVLFILIVVHLLMKPRLLVGREFFLYSWFVCYMIVELLWTEDIGLAMNTLVPAVNFVLILILFGALVTYHNNRAVFGGIFSGFLAGAALYTRIVGFPFVYPSDFSYNAIAEMYLFGLFVTLLVSCYKGQNGLLLVIGLALLACIVATTSIKVNIGILLGVTGASLFYFKDFTRMLRRNVVYLVVLGTVLSFVVASNGALVDTLQGGAQRVTLGIDVLQARENLPGYSAFEDRATWQVQGLTGWSGNPVFGNGIEAFRSRYGITSHSTAVDVLHNSGLIGFALFYGIFLSVAWRLLSASDLGSSTMRALIFGALTCYFFISLSGIMHYNSLLAVFIAISTALLNRRRLQRSPLDVSRAVADQ